MSACPRHLSLLFDIIRRIGKQRTKLWKRNALIPGDSVHFNALKVSVNHFIGPQEFHYLGNTVLLHAMPLDAMVTNSKGSPGGSVVKNFLPIQGIQVPSLSQEDPLEEEMTTPSSILAWKIPRAEEPAGLQSMELQRVRHDWVTTVTQ